MFRSHHTVLLLRRSFSSRVHSTSAHSPPSQHPPPPHQPPRPPLSTLLIHAIPIATTLSLGIWQLRRLYRKSTLIEERNAHISASPLSSSALFTSADTDHRLVTLTGELHHENEMLVGPRSAPKSLPPAVLQWGGSSGLQVVTPMTIPGGTVLLNRGWVPRRLTARQSRVKAAITPIAFLPPPENPPAIYEDATPSQSVKVVAVVRKSDDRNRFTPNNDPALDEWFYVDGPAMLRQAGFDDTHPIVLELVHPMPDIGWPFPRSLSEIAAFRTPPSTHATYAATWFTLSAAMALMSRQRLRPPRR